MGGNAPLIHCRCKGWYPKDGTHASGDRQEGRIPPQCIDTYGRRPRALGVPHYVPNGTPGRVLATHSCPAIGRKSVKEHMAEVPGVTV